MERKFKTMMHLHVRVENGGGAVHVLPAGAESGDGGVAEDGVREGWKMVRKGRERYGGDGWFGWDGSEEDDDAGRGRGMDVKRDMVRMHRMVRGEQWVKGLSTMRTSPIPPDS